MSEGHPFLQVYTATRSTAAREHSLTPRCDGTHGPQKPRRKDGAQRQVLDLHSANTAQLLPCERATGGHRRADHEAHQSCPPRALGKLMGGCRRFPASLPCYCWAALMRTDSGLSDTSSGVDVGAGVRTKSCTVVTHHPPEGGD